VVERVRSMPSMLGAPGPAGNAGNRIERLRRAGLVAASTRGQTAGMDAVTVSPTSTALPAAREPGPVLRGARWSLREGRIRLLVALGVGILFLLSTVVLLIQLRVLAPDPGCWVAEYVRNEMPTAACRRAFRGHAELSAQVRFLTEAVGFTVPFLAGLLLVVPVTARAAATGMAGGGRELLGRLLPMLLAGLALFALVGLLSTVLRDEILAWSAWGPGRRRQLEDLGVEGVTYVARGFMALGVGALVGTVVRRTWPALVAAAVATLLLASVGGDLLHQAVSEQVATWVQVDADAEVGIPVLDWLSGGYRDTDGRVLTQEQAMDLQAARCPSCDPTRADEWVTRTFPTLYRVVLPDTYSTYFDTDVALSLAIGGACLLLTFPVALRARRRPR
jgi:hypothetical protein